MTASHLTGAHLTGVAAPDASVHAALPAIPGIPPVPGIPAVPGLPDIPGVDVTGALTRLLSGAVHSFAADTFARLSDALLATTAAPLDRTFDAPWRAMVAVAGLLALPILLAGVTTEVLAGRPVQAVKRGVLLPVLVGPLLLAARAVVALLDALVQGACGLLVQVGLGGPRGFAEGIDRMRQVLHVATGPADPTGAGASLAVVLVAGVLAFIIWVELAFRAALLLLLAAFVPLALAGLFWSATARWTRRLLESLAAVLLAPLVITMVMVLATATLTAPTGGVAAGIDQAAIALALLFLGTLGLPMTFRLIPVVVEGALVAGMGATVATRARRGAQNGARRLAAATPGGGAASRLATARPPAPGSAPGPGPMPATGQASGADARTSSRAAAAAGGSARAGAPQ